MSSRRNPESDAAVHFRMLLEMLDTSSLLRGWVRVLGVLVRIENKWTTKCVNTDDWMTGDWIEPQFGPLGDAQCARQGIALVVALTSNRRTLQHPNIRPAKRKKQSLVTTRPRSPNAGLLLFGIRLNLLACQGLLPPPFAC